MKIDKKKIVFIGIVVAVFGFIVFYTVQVTGEKDVSETELTQPEVPELQEEQKEYSSKLDAINDLKEVRESNAPSIYDQSMLDSTGTFDPLYEEKERQRIVDSIYREGRINYDAGTVRNSPSDYAKGSDSRNSSIKENEDLAIPNFSEAHSAFFSIEQQVETKPIDTITSNTDAFILVEVNGEQTVRNEERLELRMAVEAMINDQLIPRNSLVYGFVSFKANRVFIRITNIDNKPVSLKAYDLLDGNEGIYIKNSIQAEARGEVLDDIVQDINIPGVPQIGGIKQVFRRNNRNVRATIYNQYQLILKPSL